MNRIKTIQVKLITIKIFGFICLSSFINAQAQQVLEKGTTSIETSYLESRDELSDYILDTGDTLLIEFIHAPKLSGFFPIDEQGEIYFKRIKEAYVRGLTIKELKELLEKRYSEFLINPEINIRISIYKPIRVEVKGEVRSPGIIKFPASTSSAISDPTLNTNSPISTISERLKIQESKRETIVDTKDKVYNPFITKDDDYVVTLSNAIRSAGGLTSFSDLSNIEVIRYVPIGKRGGKKKAIINFVSYTNKADSTYDIRLFDGDTIIIPALQEKDPTVVPNSVLSGLSPRFINVEISGQIETPGSVKIPTEGSLSDVMNLTGPRKPLSGKVFLIRYNSDGTLLRKSIKYKSTASPGSINNPYLLSGDLITVKNSILGSTSGTLKALTDPLVGIYATKELIEGFSE